MSRARVVALLAIVTLVAVGRIAVTWPLFSQTVDEPIHVAAGYEWLHGGRYTLDREHPPLARILFALDASIEGAKAALTQPRAAIGNQLLNRNNGYRGNLAGARAGNLPFFLLGLAVVFFWTRRLAGDIPALVAAALFSALPPVLGHAGLTTTDMAAASTTAAALFALARWLDEPDWKRTVLLGLAVGIGLSSKFSFVVFFGTGALVLVGLQASGFRRLGLFAGIPGSLKPDAGSALRRLAVWISRGAVAALIAVLLIWVVYRGETGLLNDVRLATFDDQSPEYIAARYAREAGYEWFRADLLDRYYDYAGETERKHRIAGIDIVDWARAAGYPSPLAGRKGNTLAGAPPLPPPTLGQRLAEPFRAGFQWMATHARIPAPSFLAGIEYVKQHSSLGHPAYLFGKTRNTGWWYYFPVVLFFKTPLPFLLLAGLGMVVALAGTFRRGRQTESLPHIESLPHTQSLPHTRSLLGVAPTFSRSLRHEDLIAVALIPLAMLAAAMTSKINIGVRHVLPLYPFLAILAGVGAVALWQRGRRVRKAAAFLLAWFFAGTTLAHPDYLAWFNEAAGRHPERIAADSNLDWGQDLLRLAELVEEEQLQPLYCGYWGSAAWQSWIPNGRELPTYCVAGWVAVSEMTWIDKQNTNLAWLKNRTPERRVGQSIRLYFIPLCEGSVKALQPVQK